MMIRKLVSGNHRILIRNIGHLAQFAQNFSEVLSAGDVVALTGTLGAGKTSFTQLLCKALGVTRKITSPTFTLLNEYAASKLKILHGDFYRLEDAEIEASLPDLEEAMESPRVLVLLEWADKAPQLEYRWTWHLNFAYVPEDPGARCVTVTSIFPKKPDTSEAQFHDVP